METAQSSNNLLILSLSLTTLASSILAFWFYRQNKTSTRVGEKYLDEASEKGLNLLHQAMKKSQVLITDAELQGIKMAAETKLSTNKASTEFQASLSEILNQMEQSITSSVEQHQQFLSGLQTKAESSRVEVKEQAKKRADQLFANFEERLSDFLIQTEQKSTTSIELELRSARQLIETYKTEQLKLIDENIVAVMEKTLSLVLNKKLSLKEQLDLIYEALEKAKAEKFIV